MFCPVIPLFLQIIPKINCTIFRIHIRMEHFAYKSDFGCLGWEIFEWHFELKFSLLVYPMPDKHHSMPDYIITHIYYREHLSEA